MEKPADLVALADKAFPQLYRDRIEPILRQHEAGRIAAVTTFWQRLALTAGVTLAIAAAVFMFTGGLDNAILVAGAGLVFGRAWTYTPIENVTDAIKRQALGEIASAMGCAYELDGFKPGSIETFKQLSLLPVSDRAAYQDRFSGAHHGCAFAFFDGHLRKKVRSRKSSRLVTVFHGQLICIDFPKPFLGTTVVRRDAGMFNALQSWASPMHRIGLGESRLEKAFEVYGTDQVEARALIHPVFMERLLELEQQFSGKNLRCAFNAGQLLLAIEGGDRFELGSMFRSLIDETRVQRILSDLSEIVRVIDAVLTAERSTLPQ